MFGGRGDSGVKSETRFELPDPEFIYRGDDYSYKKLFEFTILNSMKTSVIADCVYEIVKLTSFIIVINICLLLDFLIFHNRNQFV